MVFNNKELYFVPPILIDYANDLLNKGHVSEIREEYAHRFEVIRDYCDYVLGVHKRSKNPPKAYARKAAKKQ